MSNTKEYLPVLYQPAMPKDMRSNMVAYHLGISPHELRGFEFPAVLEALRSDIIEVAKEFTALSFDKVRCVFIKNVNNSHRFVSPSSAELRFANAWHAPYVHMTVLNGVHAVEDLRELLYLCNLEKQGDLKW